MGRRRQSEGVASTGTNYMVLMQCSTDTEVIHEARALKTSLANQVVTVKIYSTIGNMFCESIGHHTNQTLLSD
jgi:hypothetical protein